MYRKYELKFETCQKVYSADGQCGTVFSSNVKLIGDSWITMYEIQMDKTGKFEIHKEAELFVNNPKLNIKIEREKTKIPKFELNEEALTARAQGEPLSPPIEDLVAVSEHIRKKSDPGYPKLNIKIEREKTKIPKFELNEEALTAKNNDTVLHENRKRVVEWFYGADITFPADAVKKTKTGIPKFEVGDEIRHIGIESGGETCRAIIKEIIFDGRIFKFRDKENNCIRNWKRNQIEIVEPIAPFTYVDINSLISAYPKHGSSCTISIDKITPSITETFSVELPNGHVITMPKPGDDWIEGETKKFKRGDMCLNDDCGEDKVSYTPLNKEAPNYYYYLNTDIQKCWMKEFLPQFGYGIPILSATSWTRKVILIAPKKEPYSYRDACESNHIGLEIWPGREDQQRQDEWNAIPHEHRERSESNTWCLKSWPERDEEIN